MAKGKYAGLRGKIPVAEQTANEQPTAKDEALVKALADLGDNPGIADLTDKYLDAMVQLKKFAEETAPIAATMKACEILIRKHLGAQDLEGVKVNGFTWGENFTPFPVCEDPDAIVKYFVEHGMEEQLKLTKTELGKRVEDIVKNEALANELRIVVEMVEDPETGEPKEKKTVYSNVPGVKVFLKSSLSKTKS